MNLSYNKLFMLIFSFISLIACNKNPNLKSQSTVPPTSMPTITEKPTETPFSWVDNNSQNLFNQDSYLEISKKFISFPYPAETFTTDAHQTYLKDEMRFYDFPTQDVESEKTAIVGSNVCVLYPIKNITSTTELSTLPQGTPIPLGTIIPITGDKLVCKDAIGGHDMFEFQDNWNWFYTTEYEGQAGIVFGADLFGLTNTVEQNRIVAQMYKTDGRYDVFYPVSGFYNLSEKVIETLGKDRIALQEVLSNEYYLSTSSPDDMISLYFDRIGKNASRTFREKIPLFISTDIAAHAQHLLFDRTLQYLEEFFLQPRLKNLVAAFISSLKERSDSSSKSPESLEKALLYFQVAEALLALAPDRILIKQDYGEPTISYQEKNSDDVLSAYPPEVIEEIKLMNAAEGFSNSPVFLFDDESQAIEDYSQYKIRGHYTKNGILGSYFRAMMWFGRIHFLIAQAGPQPLENTETNSSDTTSLTLNMEPIALLITDIVKHNPELFTAWSSLFDPITALIGLSDDLSFNEVLPLWKDRNVNAEDFFNWTSNKDNLLAFMVEAHEKLRPPAISGSSVFWGPSEGSERKPPMGWRLFGQRFTYDSFIHQQVSPPRLLSRDIVRGLDIMKTFGSKTADLLLAASDYPKMQGLEETLDGLEQEYSSYDELFWQQTYYNSVLRQIRDQARFESGAGFYFTETPAWNIKAMLSAHGTWAELRHDTILYVKQVYGERAGDGDFEPTFRTLPLPDPVHYIEPNIPFWQGSILSVQKLMSTLYEFNMLDDESGRALTRLLTIYNKALDIVEAEAEDKPLSKQDIKWIATIPAELSNIVLVHAGEGYIDDPDMLKMALIADVYTNAEMGIALETGISIPYRMYVALNDGQGGKRIAIGYVFSYAEFTVPMSQRMTNEEWKAEVYADNANLDNRRPFWAKDIALPPEAILRK